MRGLSSISLPGPSEELELALGARFLESVVAGGVPPGAGVDFSLKILPEQDVKSELPSKSAKVQQIPEVVIKLQKAILRERLGFCMIGALIAFLLAGFFMTANEVQNLCQSAS